MKYTRLNYPRLNYPRLNYPGLNYPGLFVVLLSAALISACGTKYSLPAQTPAEPVEQPDEPVVLQRQVINPTTREAPVRRLPAVVALRDQAAIASTANDHSRAIGILERALRISPNDPQTFYDLAASHLALQQPQQALQLARRAIGLNPTPRQRQAIEDLISRSEAML